MLNKLKTKDKEYRYKKSFKNFLAWLLIGLIITIIVQVIDLKTTEEINKFFGTRFVAFVLNYLIVLLLTSLAFLVNKFKSMYSLIAVIILGFAITDRVLLDLRGTPITASDFYSIKDGLAVVKEYINVPTLLMILAGVVLIIGLIVFAFIKEKKDKKFSIKTNIIYILIPIILITTGYTTYALKTKKVEVINWDIPSSYRYNGFVFSFLESITQLVPKKPKDYSKETLNVIKENLDSVSKEVSLNNAVKPNVIIVQLESFMDPTRIKGVEFSEDPIPNIRRLMETQGNGKYIASSFGGGTVRAEFETLTGFSANNLSAGEIPNNTILKKQSVETVAYMLRKQGYNAAALHNYQGEFYYRNEVYANLGFDEFVSQEYMPTLSYAVEYIGGFPSDMSNMESIQTLIAREEPQFIFNITAQGHGAYAKDYESLRYTVSGDITDEERNQLQNFIDKTTLVDKYVAELIGYVESTGEPTIIGFYGDHLPSMELVSKEDNFPQDEIYKTDFVTWNNMGIVYEDRDVAGYQFSDYLLGGQNLNIGTMPLFHRNFKDDPKYGEYLKSVQYDQLHGKNYLNAAKDYKKTSMQLGVLPINVASVYKEASNLIIEGENFTTYTRVEDNGEIIDVAFESRNKLIIPEYKGDSDKIKIIQIGRYNKAMGVVGEFPVKASK